MINETHFYQGVNNFCSKLKLDKIIILFEILTNCLFQYI